MPENDDTAGLLSASCDCSDPPTPGGLVCHNMPFLAQRGVNINFRFSNKPLQSPARTSTNLLFDQDQDRQWGGFTLSSPDRGNRMVPEHVMTNVVVPSPIPDSLFVQNMPVSAGKVNCSEALQNIYVAGDGTKLWINFLSKQSVTFCSQETAIMVRMETIDRCHLILRFLGLNQQEPEHHRRDEFSSFRNTYVLAPDGSYKTGVSLHGSGNKLYNNLEPTRHFRRFRKHGFQSNRDYDLKNLCPE